MILRPVIFICVLIGAASVLPAMAEESISVVYDDGRPRETVSTYTLPDDAGVRFIRANDVARLFRATQFWNSSTRKIVLGVGPARFVLSVDTRVVVIDGEPVMMHTPVRYDGGFVLVPLEFVLDIASHYTPRTFLWDESARTLRVRGLTYNVEKVTFASTGDRTTVTVTLSEPLLHHMDANTPGLVRLKLYSGRVDVNAVSGRQKRGLVEGVRAEQSERDAFIFLDVDPGTRRIHVDRKDNPPQLVLTLEKGELPDIPDPGLEDRESVQIFERGAVERRVMDIKRICIDPGHGGHDDGKTGASGVREKDVNLQLSLAIRDALKERGFDVVLTRDDDRLVSLSRRTEIANEARADLFISVHCNAWFSERTGGFEAYFLAPAQSESERTLARFENSSGGGGGGATPSGDLEFIIWDLVQNEYINESSSLAEYIQKAMDDRLGIRSRGVKQAGFTVLQGARMPAVLIETAFLSNPSEEALLTDPDFQRQVAEGVVEAVRRLQDRYR